MNVDMVQEFLAFNIWANKQVFDAVARLDTERFTRIVGGSYPSIQSTLTHIVWVEWTWLERWKGNSPQEVWVTEDFPLVADLASRWRRVQAEQQRFVQSVTTEGLQRVIRYTNRLGEECEYALWRMIYHLVNHSTYHRGQVTNMLRVLDAKPATTDFLDWWDQGR